MGNLFEFIVKSLSLELSRRLAKQMAKPAKQKLADDQVVTAKNFSESSKIKTPE
jgi:hypothetical protein